MRKTMKSAYSKLLTGALLGGSMVVVGCGPQGLDHDYQDTTTPLTPQQFPEREYVDPGVVPDGAAPLLGSVKNVLTNEYVSDVALYTNGITPAVEGTSNDQGSFELSIPVGSVFWLRAYKSGYAYTYDKVDMSIPAAQYNQNAYIVNQADIDAMATAFGKTQQPGCGIILGSTKYGGQYQANVDSFALSGNLSQIDYEGPYFLDENNQADPAAEYTSAGGRFVYFNVCDGGQASIQDGRQVSVQADGQYYSSPKNITVYQGGVTLVTLEVEDGGGPEPEPDPEAVIDFPTQIMPIFAKYGCSGCHAAGGAAENTGLYFNEDPEQVWYTLTNDPDVVNVQYPEQSYLLTYPLYEEPPNHPNASFEDTYNEDYVLILDWIEAQAPYGVNEPPDPDLDPPVYDIYGAAQIFDNRCNGCHGDNQNGAYAALNLSTPPDNGLIDVIAPAINFDYPDRSKLLAYPYCGQDPAKCQNDPYWADYAGNHPTTVFQVKEDPDYVALLSFLENVEPIDVVPPVEFNTTYPFKYDVQEAFVSVECVRCHNEVTNEGNLDLLGDPYTVCENIYLNYFDAQYPEQSLLITKPTAQFADVNHTGGKPVQTTNDNFAQYVGGWMYNDGNCPDQQIRSFATDILPLFDAPLNCLGCHNADQVEGGLNLEADPNDAAAVQAVYDYVKANVVDPNYYPYNSALLQKPFAGVQLFANIAHTGNKRDVINNAQYREAFVKIATWIEQGAEP